MKYSICPENARSCSSVIIRELKNSKSTGTPTQNELLKSMAHAMGFDSKNAMEHYAKQKSNLSPTSIELINELIKGLKGVLHGDNHAHRYIFDQMAKVRENLPSTYLRETIPDDYQICLISVDQFENELTIYKNHNSLKAKYFESGDEYILSNDQIESDIYETAIVTEMLCSYPNASRYGTPVEASFPGGIEYLDSIGLCFLADYDHYAFDTGDDSGSVVYLSVMLPKHVFDAIEQHIKIIN
ncbi:MAG: hypothetical protein QM500_19500 [Methylococcales bacterium]